jgi:hypothetical protein
MSGTAAVYARARSEIIALFRWDAGSLSPDQMLRLDCAVALRLALDDLQGRLIRGESIDMNRMLTASEALSRLLPPAVLASPPPEHRVDPRQIMWETYIGMRRRGEIAGPEYSRDAALKRIAELEAETAALKAADAPTTAVPPTPLPDNVVKLSSRNDNPSPSSPASAAPAAPPKPAPPPPAAASAPVLGDLVMVVDPSPDEEWKSYVEPDGSIRATPFSGGKYWGPV